MAESSDGESINRQFNHIKIEKAGNKIANTYAFRKLCHNLKNGVPNENCVIELKAIANVDDFKKSLSIPKNTNIEPNIVNKVVSFLFSYKNNSHIVKIKLTDSVINGFSESYIQMHLKPNAANKKASPVSNIPNEQNISIDNENPSAVIQNSGQDINLNVDHSNSKGLEEKIGELTEQLSKLVALLTKEREKNKQLSDQLCALEMKQQSVNTKRKRKVASKPITVTPNNESNDKIENDNVNSNMSCEDADDDLTFDNETQDLNKQNANANINDTTSAKSKQSTQPPIGIDVTQTNKNVNTESNVFESKSATINTPKRDKNIPPVVVHDCDQKRMNERILSRNICARNEFHFTRVNKSKYRIHVSSLEQYDTLLVLLNELCIKYHTYTPSDRKSIHVLLKHIPICYDESDILIFLKEDYCLTPIRLTKFTTKSMIDKNIQSTMWHASFDPKTDKKRIFGIKHIGGQFGIVIEEMKNKSLTQCRRCWRFEHTQSNCSYDARCNNCLITHGPGNCALDSNEALKPSCVNCKNDSHAATSKDCPVYLRILERRKSPGNKKMQSNPSTVSNKIHLSTSPNLSFANILKNDKQTPQKSQHGVKTNIASADPAIIDIFKQLALQQAQMNSLLMKIAPQLVSGLSK